MKQDVKVPDAHSHLVNICKSLINERPWNIKIMHVYREENGCADWLANLGVTMAQQGVSYDYDGILGQLSHLAQQDVGGVSWPRVIPFYAN